MKLKSPHFWYKPSTWQANILQPLAYLYDTGRNLLASKTTPYHASIPVLCIGNITIGGSGKTPTVQSLIPLLIDAKICRNPCILSRGYGGSKDLHVVTNNDTYKDVGDEPLLLLETAPVVIAKNRAEGAKLIESMGYDLIIMDDGFQNHTLHKNLQFLVLDGKMGFGNQRLLPAGPLREPLQSGLDRADAVILINQDTYGAQSLLGGRLPIFKAAVEPMSDIDTSQDYIGFCGISHPEKFRKTLHDLKLNLKNFIDYPDHYPFTDEDVRFLIKQASDKNARLITTQKDAIRLKSYPDLLPHLDVLAINLKWEHPDDIITFIREKATISL